MLDSSIIWLGFDSPQLFGKYSNRTVKDTDFDEFLEFFTNFV